MSAVFFETVANSPLAAWAREASELAMTCASDVRQRNAASATSLLTLIALFRALHRRAEPDAAAAALGDDVLVSVLHTAFARAHADRGDDRGPVDALRLLLSLLEAQFARPQLPAYWSRQFFFESDHSSALVAALGAPPPPRQRTVRVLALHVLAALVHVRPVEHADENAVEQLSRTALRLRGLTDVPLLDLLTAAIDEGLRRCLKFYALNSAPMSRVDDNVFDRIAGILAAPFAFLVGLPVEGVVPSDASAPLHHEVRDTAAALTLLHELLHNDAWCARLLDSAASAGACPRLVRRLLLLSSFVFGDAQDERSLLYSSVCASLLERVVARAPLFARLARDAEPMLLFSLSSAHAAPPELAGAAPVLAALTQLLHRARSGPLALDTLTRAVRALLATLRAAREQRLAIQWTRFASLWRAALTLLQRLAPLRVSSDARCLCILTLQLLNDGITFGNVFLPSPGDYDALFYELLLQRGALEDVFHAVDLSDNAPERPALLAQLVNLRIIVTHFSTLLMTFDDTADDANAVLRVIQRGMQTLKLRLLPPPPADASEQQRRERVLLHRFVAAAISDAMAADSDDDDAKQQQQQQQQQDQQQTA